MESVLYRNFEKTVREFEMIHSGEEIIVGVSGGADSVCLLFLLRHFMEKMPFTLRAVHVNHMIRGVAADSDEAFTKELCEKLNVPFYSEKVDVPSLAKERKLSEEEAGREARFEIFRREAKAKGAKIALAHHQDDNAETVLLNLVRGTGIRGLSGIRPVSEREGVTIIRPLLYQSREDIEYFLREMQIPFCEDATNQEDVYSRNLIRLHVLPELSKLNEKAAAHIAKTAEMAGEIEVFLERETKAAYEKAATSNTNGVRLSIKELETIDPVIQKRVVLQAVEKAAGRRKDITSSHVDSVLELLSLQSGKMISLPYGLSARRQYDEICVEKETPVLSLETIAIRKEDLGPEDKTVLLSDGRELTFRKIAVNNSNRTALMEKNQYTKAFDYDKILGVIKVGEKVPGDAIWLKTGRKTLKKLFIDEKIPVEKRRLLPVISDRESVIWVVGSRISERHKITQTTKEAVIIKTSKGEDGREYSSIDPGTGR